MHICLLLRCSHVGSPIRHNTGIVLRIGMENIRGHILAAFQRAKPMSGCIWYLVNHGLYNMAKVIFGFISKPWVVERPPSNQSRAYFLFWPRAYWTLNLNPKKITGGHITCKRMIPQPRRAYARVGSAAGLTSGSFASMATTRQATISATNAFAFSRSAAHRSRAGPGRQKRYW